MKRTTVFKTAVFLWTALVCWGQTTVAGPPKPATEQEIKDLIAAAGEAKDYDAAALVYVLDEADVYVQESGLATTESCQVVKILTDAGTRSQSVLRHEFDPATNRVTIKSVRLHRKGGGVEDVPVDGVITQPAPQHAIYWGNLQHVLPIPRVEIGDCLEIRISKTGFNIAYLQGAPETGDKPGAGGPSGGGAAVGGSPLTSSVKGTPDEELQPPMPGHWYETTLWQGSYPIAKKRYSVHMPKDKPVQFQVYNGPLQSSLWFGEKADVYSWWAEKTGPFKGEPSMTSIDDHAAKLVMATVPDWPMKSRWFYEVNEPQFAADDAIRAKVKELTDGLPDEEAKIQALLHWVADNVRYYGTSRGPCEGFTLHKGIETFRDRGGVCKDKAGMLITMLRVLGLEVYPALTMAGSRVEEIPADQFNHTITVMRTEDGTFRILDPTWSPLSRETWSSWEARQHLVYGTPEGQDLTQSPFYPPEYSTFAGRADCELGEDGTLSARIVIDMKNSPCTSFRRNVERNSKSEQRACLEQAVAIAPNTRVEQLEWTNPYDYSRDSQVNMTISAADYAAGQDGVRLFHLPLLTRPLGAFTLPDLNYSLDAKERKTDLRLRATRVVRFEETIKLPPGWKVGKVPEAKKLDNRAAALSFEATPGDGVLTYRFELTIKNHIIPAKDYADYKKVIDAMNDLTHEWIVCQVAEAKDSTTKDDDAETATEVQHD